MGREYRKYREALSKWEPGDSRVVEYNDSEYVVTRHLVSNASHKAPSFSVWKDGKNWPYYTSIGKHCQCDCEHWVYRARHAGRVCKHHSIIHLALYGKE